MTSKTQTVQRIETVEVQLYDCPFCEQSHEEEEMVEIGVDRREIADMKSRYHHKGRLCVYCAESIFGYERPSSSYNWTHVPREILGLSFEAYVAIFMIEVVTFVTAFVLGAVIL